MQICFKKSKIFLNIIVDFRKSFFFNVQQKNPTAGICGQASNPVSGLQMIILSKINRGQLFLVT